MSRSLACLAILIGALPVAVQVPGGGDSSSTSGPALSGTRVRLAGGAGTYSFVARGCQGEVLDEVPAHFKDASVSVEQRLGRSPILVGARGGWIRDRIDTTSSPRFAGVPVGQTTDNRYLNPYFDLDPGPAAIGAGYVFHQREFLTAGEGAREAVDHPLNDLSFHLRIGRLDRRYFAVRWMESEPLASGGGYLTVGLGTRHRPLSVYGGMGAGGPYEGAGAMLSLGLDIGPWTRIEMAGRADWSGPSTAYGGSLGLEFRTPDPH